MSSKQLESDNIETETWIHLKNPHIEHQEETANTFCPFISSFYWRWNSERSELIMILHQDDGEKIHYKYYGVPKDVYAEARDLAYNPSDYDQGFAGWYSSNIKGEYEYDRYDAH